jgi:hypothetical protein
MHEVELRPAPADGLSHSALSAADAALRRQRREAGFAAGAETICFKDARVIASGVGSTWLCSRSPFTWASGKRAGGATRRGVDLGAACTDGLGRMRDEIATMQVSFGSVDDHAGFPRSRARR